MPLRVMSGTGCRECGAVYESGRWIWSATARVTHQLLCPACRRILEHAPAGELWLESCEYLHTQLVQIVSFLSDEAQREKECHPMERIIGINVEPGGVRVTTSGPHILRRLGSAMLRAHHGELSIEYRDGEAVARANWTRQG